MFVEKVNRRVGIKRLWSDEWDYGDDNEDVAAIIPHATSMVLGPGVGRSEFRYWFGYGHREEEFGADPRSLHPPMTILDWYITIQRTSWDDTGTWENVWYGIVQNDRTTTLRNDILTGDQHITAFELAHLLDREPIRGSYILEGEDIICSDRTLVFNQRPDAGGDDDSVIGNRSTLTASNGTFAFSARDQEFNRAEPYIWSNLDILYYLLYWFGPEAFNIEVTGQFGILSNLKGVYSFENKTLWAALSELIPKKAGVGYRLRVDPDTEQVELYIFSQVETDLVYGDITLPANPSIKTFSLPLGAPFNNVVEPLIWDNNVQYRYDFIEIWGGPVRVIGTFTDSDGTLVPGWTEGLQQKYIAAGGLDDEKQIAAYRNDDKFQDVFMTYVVPDDWNWRVKNGKDGEGRAEHSLLPIVTDDGEVHFDDPEESSDNALFSGTSDGCIHNRTIQFLVADEKVPFYSGIEYTDSPTVNNNDQGEVPERLALMVWVKDAAADSSSSVPAFSSATGDIPEDAQHETTGRWFQVDAFPIEEDNFDNFHNFHVIALNRRLGFRLSGAYNHYFITRDTQIEILDEKTPEFFCDRIVATMMFATHARLHYKIALPRTGVADDVTRTLVIEIPDAEYWHVASRPVGPGFDIDNFFTVCGIDADGQPLYFHPANNPPRDDRDQLKAVAAFAEAWYGVTRQRLQLTIKIIDDWGLALGDFITDITANEAREDINTVLSSITIDWLNDNVSFETDYGEFDALGMFTTMGRQGGQSVNYSGDVHGRPGIRGKSGSGTARRR